jgi:hypothetical protein
MDRDENSAVNIYQRFVAVQFSKGGKLEEIRVYQHAVTADSQ